MRLPLEFQIIRNGGIAKIFTLPFLVAPSLRLTSNGIVYVGAWSCFIYQTFGFFRFFTQFFEIHILFGLHAIHELFDYITAMQVGLWLPCIVFGTEAFPAYAEYTSFLFFGVINDLIDLPFFFGILFGIFVSLIGSWWSAFTFFSDGRWTFLRRSSQLLKGRVKKMQNFAWIVIPTLLFDAHS